VKGCVPAGQINQRRQRTRRLISMIRAQRLWLRGTIHQRKETLVSTTHALRRRRGGGGGQSARRPRRHQSTSDGMGGERDQRHREDQQLERGRYDGGGRGERVVREKAAILHVCCSSRRAPTHPYTTQPW
jgi:hypothetical protein